MKEFIIKPLANTMNPRTMPREKVVYDLLTAFQGGIMQVQRPSYSRLPRELLLRGVRDILLPAIVREIAGQPPNLTLNVTGANSSPVVTWLFACMGILIQLGVFAVASLVTYKWQLGRGESNSIVEYGFPLFLIGLALL
jgi:hypothetical protein